MNLSLIDLVEVEAARDAAMALCLANAAAKRNHFARDARAFIVAYLEQHGPTSGEELTTRCVLAGIEPHDHRAFGGVFNGLCHHGQIVKVGFGQRLKGHKTSGLIVWDRSR